jgi:hypothetical protein
MGFASKRAQGAFFQELFIGLLSGFHISLVELEHPIKQAGEFVGPGVDGRRCSKTRFNASGEGADGSFALHGALGSQAQGSNQAPAPSL